MFSGGHHDTKRERPRPPPGEFGRGGQGEARPGNSAPRGGPQLELCRTRLKSWSKSHPSTALVQLPDILPCIYVEDPSLSIQHGLADQRTELYAIHSAAINMNYEQAGLVRQEQGQDQQAVRDQGAGGERFVCLWYRLVHARRPKPFQHPKFTPIFWSLTLHFCTRELYAPLPSRSRMPLFFFGPADFFRPNIISPPTVKIPAPTIIVEKNKTYLCIYVFFFFERLSRTPPVKKLAHIVYYKYQQRSLQI